MFEVLHVEIPTTAMRSGPAVLLAYMRVKTNGVKRNTTLTRTLPTHSQVFQAREHPSDCRAIVLRYMRMMRLRCSLTLGEVEYTREAHVCGHDCFSPNYVAATADHQR
jgi:hypothetical protein